jgi:hypothetical protein
MIVEESSASAKKIRFLSEEDKLLQSPNGMIFYSAQDDLVSLQGFTFSLTN